MSPFERWMLHFVFAWVIIYSIISTVIAIVT